MLNWVQSQKIDFLIYTVKVFNKTTGLLIGLLNKDRIVTGNLTPKIFGFLFAVQSIGSKSKIFRLYNSYLASNLNVNHRKLAHLIAQSNYSTSGQMGTLLAKVRVNRNLKFKDSKLLDSSNHQRVLSELRLQGYSKIINISDLPFFSYLDQLKNEPVYSSLLWKSDRYKRLKFQDRPDPNQDFIWYVSPKSVLKNPGFEKLIMDPFWKNISDDYLNGDSKIFSIRCWHSFPKNNSEYSTPENWHTDVGDGFNFIKFFVALTDIEATNGPTQILPINKNNLKKRFLANRRFSEEEITKYMKKLGVSPISAIVEKGTIYVADTRQIHRGMPVVSGNRFLFNFTVAIDDFGSLASEGYGNVFGSNGVSLSQFHVSCARDLQGKRVVQY